MFSRLEREGLDVYALESKRELTQLLSNLVKDCSYLYYARPTTSK